ncbi:hypothetical protein [Streptomyces sp. NPDC006638]|uniref:hypothetical protein n=1 Tax=Streptomyces sp. NPDC006638 TaxID=3157183 RepID=UPI0033BD862D
MNSREATLVTFLPDPSDTARSTGTPLVSATMNTVTVTTHTALLGNCVSSHTGVFVHLDDNERRGPVSTFLDASGRPEELNVRLASNADSTRTFIEVWGHGEDAELDATGARAYARRQRAAATTLDRLADQLDQLAGKP